MYNHNKAQQSKNRVHISWDILYYQENDALCEDYTVYSDISHSNSDTPLDLRTVKPCNGKVI